MTDAPPPGALLTLLGFLTGGLVLTLRARRLGVATEGGACIALAALTGGLLGARLAEWLVAGPHAIPLLDPRLTGRSILGGVAGGWAGVLLAKRLLGIRRSTGDLFALALPAGEAVGRLGCFVNACCHGAPASVPWAVFQHGAWRHPAQLYSALGAACLFALLYRQRDRLPREGDLFRLYLVLWAALRFGIEFVRDRPPGPLGLSAAQGACLLLAAAGAWPLVAARGPVLRPFRRLALKIRRQRT